MPFTNCVISWEIFGKIFVYVFAMNISFYVIHMWWNRNEINCEHLNPLSQYDYIMVYFIRVNPHRASWSIPNMYVGLLFSRLSILNYGNLNPIPNWNVHLVKQVTHHYNNGHLFVIIITFSVFFQWHAIKTGCSYSYSCQPQKPMYCPHYFKVSPGNYSPKFKFMSIQFSLTDVMLDLREN